MPRYSKIEVQESLARLRALVKPGTEVQCILRHVSKSGMMRHISFAVVHKGDLVSISWDAARVLGYPLTNDHALKVSGAGMDMGFHVVYSLSVALHGREDRGTDAQESGAAGRPFKPRRGHFRAGYSLTHRWV